MKALEGISAKLLVVVVVCAVATMVAFERFRPVGLSYDGLWNARTGVLATVLLFANLVVLWWYALRTADLAASTAKQVEISQAEAESLRRPCVVIEWQAVPSSRPESPHGYWYVARNIGRGIALNVIYVTNHQDDKLSILHIGALEPGQSVKLPDSVIQDLKSELVVTRKRHVLIAEPLGGDQWIMSENLHEMGDRFSHRVRTRRLTALEMAQIHRETPDEYVRTHWPDIRRDLDRMLSEVETGGNPAK